MTTNNIIAAKLVLTFNGWVGTPVITAVLLRLSIFGQTFYLFKIQLGWPLDFLVDVLKATFTRVKQVKLIPKAKHQLQLRLVETDKVSFEVFEAFIFHLQRWYFQYKTAINLFTLNQVTIISFIWNWLSTFSLQIHGFDVHETTRSLLTPSISNPRRTWRDKIKRPFFAGLEFTGRKVAH